LSKPDPDPASYFALFNEIAIIAQLSGSLLERRLPDGFLVSHFAVLNHLTRLGDGRTPLQIARAFQVPKTTMTHTLQGLEKAGLIAFAPNPRDGRSKCVTLTDAGRGFHEASINALGPDIARIARGFPPRRSPRSFRHWPNCAAGLTATEGRADRQSFALGFSADLLRRSPVHGCGCACD
jgi:DNA-binding MarR family transcriptional regulator